MKVFLSHSSADKDIARRLALDLRAASVDVWLDEWEVRVGEAFAQLIERGLDEVEFVVVLLTESSVASEWVDREWRRKVQHEAQTNRISVVPVRAEPCEMPDFLAQRSHADISGGSYPLGFRHLLTILRHYSDETSIMLPEGAAVTESSQDFLPIVTPIVLEVGRALIPFFEPNDEGANRAVDELAPNMRNTLRAELGFPFPGVRIRGNDTDMPPRLAVILIDEIPETTIEVEGEDLVPDPAEYLFLELAGLLRQMASWFIDLDVARRLVDEVEAVAPDLVAQTVPKTVSWYELTDVLQQLVDEGIGIGDMTSILQALSQRRPEPEDAGARVERVRSALKKQITATFTRGRHSLPVMLLDPEVEKLIDGALRRTPDATYLDLAPEVSQGILAATHDTVGSLDDPSGIPILVTSPEVRPFLRRLISREFPGLQVLSRHDLLPDATIEAVSTIRLTRRPGITGAPESGTSA